MQVLLLTAGSKLWMAEFPWRQASTVERTATGSTYTARKLNDSFHEHMQRYVLASSLDFAMI